jgi:cyclomaltodextrinase
MWAYESTFYQIYPLGFCGAPFPNNDIKSNRLASIKNFIPHLKYIGINALLLNPLFESDNHGYDTRDYKKVDSRLGTNSDLKKLISNLHNNDIRVIFDGVFNHVGRGFVFFQDVLKNREASPYKDWFYINFSDNNGYNDNLSYEGWEGHFELVKLNLKNPQVSDYLIDVVKFWINEFKIDGLRLDVSYCLDPDFISRLRFETSMCKDDFFLFGEILNGDYKAIMNDNMCHSATNYECYKGLYSSMNSYNLFEIVHSLKRQFGPEDWTLYKGMHLLSFVDNHDVTRISSILNNKNHLKLIYALMFFMPGIPCIYYGSEWGITGNKSDGDIALRPAVTSPVTNELTKYVKVLTSIRQSCKVLSYGDFSDLFITNKQCVLQRSLGEDCLLLVLNIDEVNFHAAFNTNIAHAHDLINDIDIDINGGIDIPPYTAMILKPY